MTPVTLAAVSGNPLVGKTVCDFEQLGRALAMRHRVGRIHVFDVIERAKVLRERSGGHYGGQVVQSREDNL